MTLKRLSEFGLSLLLSLSSLLVIAVPKVHAAPITWDGGGSDNNFSTVENWVGDAVPQNGDSLIFPDSAPADSLEINNDMTLSVAGISFTGSSQAFTITGNELTLTGNIVADSDSKLFLDITLGASITITSNSPFFDLGSFSENHTLDLGSYTLTVETAIGENVLGKMDISGTGSIVKNGVGLFQMVGNNTFSGSLTINGGSLYVENAQTMGTTAGGTTINDGAAILFCAGGDDLTIAEPITLSGSGVSGGAFTDEKIWVGGCGGGALDDITVNLTGSLTLASDVIMEGSNNHTLKISGPLSGAHTIELAAGQAANLVIDSSNNTSNTPNGTQESEEEVITINEGDDQPGLGVSIQANQTYVINGARGAVTVNDGGKLKGTGTVGDLFVDEGGTLAPGLSPGCINSGHLTLNGTFEVEIGGTTECTEYDQTKVTGTVDVTGGILNIVRFNNFTPAAGQTYKIIDNDSNDAVTGTFQGLAEAATVTVDGYVYRISYVGGDGNDVVLTVVSIPGTPDTGFRMLASNPLMTLGIAMFAAGAILVIAKKYNRTTVRR